MLLVWLEKNINCCPYPLDTSNTISGNHWLPLPQRLSFIDCLLNYLHVNFNCPIISFCKTVEKTHTFSVFDFFLFILQRMLCSILTFIIQKIKTCAFKLGKHSLKCLFVYLLIFPKGRYTLQPRILITCTNNGIIYKHNTNFLTIKQIKLEKMRHNKFSQFVSWQQAISNTSEVYYIPIYKLSLFEPIIGKQPQRHVIIVNRSTVVNPSNYFMYLLYCHHCYYSFIIKFVHLRFKLMVL